MSQISFSSAPVNVDVFGKSKVRNQRYSFIFALQEGFLCFKLEQSILGCLFTPRYLDKYMLMLPQMIGNLGSTWLSV